MLLTAIVITFPMHWKPSYTTDYPILLVPKVLGFCNKSMFLFTVLKLLSSALYLQGVASEKQTRWCVDSEKVAWNLQLNKHTVFGN